MTPRSQPLHSTDQLAPRVLFHDNKEYTMPTLTGLFTIGHAEQRVTARGTPTLQLSLAYDYGRKGDDGRKPTQWVRAAIFGKQAEAMAPYLKKGQQVTIVGSATEREYTDKDGQKRTSMELRVNDLALQGGRPEAQQEAPRAAPQRQAPHQIDEDIPF